MARKRLFGRNPRSVRRPDSLLDAIVELTDCPCPAHQTAFLQLFDEADELLFLVTDSDVDLVNGQHRRIAGDERMALQTVVANDQAMLLAFPDEATALRHDREAPYAGLTVQHAASMVLADESLAGILVSAADPGSSWAAVTRGHLHDLATPI